MTRFKEQLANRPRPFVTQKVPYVIPDESLLDAAEIAILLGQPLVLAGEPGVGKTGFAYELAEQTELFMHSEIAVSTTTEGRNLLYTFDEVKRFRDSQAGATPDKLVSYVRFTGFGRAILWAAGPQTKVRVNPALKAEDVAIAKPVAPSTYVLGDLFPDEFSDPALGEIKKPISSLVLLDEFDKAPRDAPNDLLRAVERMTFTIDELGLEIGVGYTDQSRAWPMLVLTSNSERSLPDAFLRRCVFYWIDFPKGKMLEQIVANHCAHYHGSGPAGQSDERYDVQDWEDSNFVRDVAKVLIEMRQLVVNKKPATGELLAFVSVLINRHDITPFTPLKRTDLMVTEALGALLKTHHDLERAKG